MKRTFNLVTLASLMLFAVACGKDNSSGGSSKSLSLLNGNVNLSQTSTQAVANLNAWYQSTQEGVTPNIGIIGVMRSTMQSSSTNGCTEKDIKIFGVKVGVWYDCSNVNTTSNGAVADCSVVVYANGSNVKPNNQSLVKIMNGRSQIGELVNASQSGNVYTLQFQRSTGSVVTYVIDTYYHSAFQPVYVHDSATQEINKFEQRFVNAAGLSSCPAL